MALNSSTDEAHTDTVQLHEKNESVSEFMKDEDDGISLCPNNNFFCVCEWMVGLKKKTERKIKPSPAGN